jgi:hypothetical protein
MRGSWKVVTLCLALAVGLAAMIGGTAAAKPHKRHAPAKLRVLHPSQSSILKRGVLVRVSSRRAGKVRLSGTSSTFDDGRRRLTKKVVVNFRRPGKKVVRLPLLRAARKATRSCAARTIEVRAGRSRTKADLRRTGDCRPAGITIKSAEGCDFIAEPGNAPCLLPFPNDFYTVADPSSETGRRVDFKTAGLPANGVGQHIDAGVYSASNGFSQGAAILLKIPGIESVADVNAMGATPINDIGSFTKKDAPVVVIDAASGKRWPIWSEIDSNAKDPAKRLLEIHPAVNFASGGRYIVAIRNVKNAAGTKIEAPGGFRFYRDEIPSANKAISARRQHFKGIFKTLKKAGIRRDSLYLAWDFTTATDENNARRMLAIRNDAFAQLGDTNLADGVVAGKSPEFQVTSVEENPNPGEIARRIKGTVKVPCYLFPDCGVGGTFKLGANEVPMQNGSWDANFDCIVPESVSTGPAGVGRPSLYGHGLFGSAGEVGALAERSLAQAHKIVFCATDEIGMSAADQGGIVGVLNNLSGFPKIADRLQQGMLNELYLGRAMVTGFATADAFNQDGTAGTGSVIDTRQLYYNGNSQGGIEGGALTAIAPDFTRSSLGVPGMNYSVLLPRSVDFDKFAGFLYPAYPDEAVRPLALDLIQMLWDRGEPNGYAHRMTTNPLPNTPAHQVLLDVGLGDHQVTDYQADVEARTIGASAHQPALFNGRWPNSNALWNLPAITSFPFTGSAIYYWDTGPIRPDPLNPGKTIGVEPPPFENSPNRPGEDPHEFPRLAAAEQQLVSRFFEGAIQQSDDCGGGPCYAGSFTGP